MSGRLEGKVCVITGAAGGIGAEAATLFRAEGATVVGVDLRDDFEGVDLALAADVADEEAVIALHGPRGVRVRAHRRALQQRRHLPRRRRLRARHDARGLAARAGRQPALGLPVLQARDPACCWSPAAGR